MAFKSYPAQKNGWIYLHIEGSPKERGFQHGYFLSKEIKESIRIISEVWKYQTAMKWSWYVDRGHDTHDNYYNPLCNVIIDILPEKGHRILMQTSFLNSIHNMTG